ncbi:hypothetical protein MKEN_00640700 [Mycena kentingensis (nom. inval.)]|nr:hypothetical protein MKEN_00640700 [Mycena kentingensis (nom. inval.)]
MENDLLASTRAVVVQNYCHVFGMMILLWDHVITLDAEVSYIWPRRTSPGAILFFLVRYGASLSNIPVVVFSFVELSDRGCTLHSVIHYVLLILVQLLICVIMIQRMAALYGSTRLLYALAATALVLLGITVFLAMKQTSIPMPLHGLPGCHSGLSRKSAYHLAGAWLALFLFDSIIFALTVVNAWRTASEQASASCPPSPADSPRETNHDRASSSLQMHMPIHALFFRDGALYFAAMAAANFANILTFLIPSRTIIPGSLTIFTTCISVAMVSRLVINVHEKAVAASAGSDAYGCSVSFDFEFLSGQEGRALDPEEV